MFFSGPDFYVGGSHPKAIDFNPRLGFFYNMLESHRENSLTKNYFSGDKVGISKHMIWSASNLESGEFSSISDLEDLKKDLTEEIFLSDSKKVIPELQTLQNRDFNLSYKLFGDSENELLERVDEFNLEVQKRVTYKD